MVGRGFFSGVFWAALVATPILVVSSLLGEQPPGNTPPEIPTVDVPAGVDGGSVANPAAPELGQAVLLDPLSDGSSPTVTVPDLELSPPSADFQSTGLPETGAVSADLTAPEATAETGVDLEIEEPVFPNPQAQAPVVPEEEGELSISTDPAQPPAPEVEEGSAFGVIDAPDPDEEFEFVEVPEGTDENVLEEFVVVLPDADTPDVPNEERTLVEIPEEVAPETLVEDAEVVDAVNAAPTGVETEAPEQPQPGVIEENALGTTTAETARQGETETPLVVPEAEEPIVTALVEQETSAGELINLAPEVRINRPVAEEPEAAESEVPQDDTDLDDLPALERFAAPFENPEEKPLLSVILIDDGEGNLGPEALSSFTFPVTVAIDATRPDAGSVMQAYRDAGLEVVVLTNLPRGAQPSDLEIAFEAYAQAVPEAVAVMDGGANGFQEDRALVSQVTEILLANGQGLVTQARGLNSVQRVAQEAGVASALIHRDLDVAGQDARVIRRFLDQAAFKARQDGSVVLLGRLRPNTISALLLWGAASRADDIVFAPISAVLTAQ